MLYSNTHLVRLTSFHCSAGKPTTAPTPDTQNRTSMNEGISELARGGGQGANIHEPHEENGKQKLCVWGGRRAQVIDVMLHLVRLELEPREEFLDAERLLVVVGGQPSSRSCCSSSSDGSPGSPELLGDLLEGLIVYTASQLAGGQLCPDFLPELHAGAG